MITTKIKSTNPIGSRVVSIRTKKMRLLGMERALTVTEENYTNALREASIPQPVFPHKFFEMRREFTPEQLGVFLKDNTKFHSIVKQVRPFATHNSQRINVFRPIIKSVKPLAWDQVRSSLEVGIFGGYDVVCVPDFHFKDKQAFEEHVAKSREHIYDASTTMKGDFECQYLNR